jgi:hypothetical protein
VTLTSAGEPAGHQAAVGPAVVPADGNPSYRSARGAGGVGAVGAAGAAGEAGAVRLRSSPQARWRTRLVVLGVLLCGDTGRHARHQGSECDKYRRQGLPPTAVAVAADRLSGATTVGARTQQGLSDPVPASAHATVSSIAPRSRRVGGPARRRLQLR